MAWKVRPLFAAAALFAGAVIAAPLRSGDTQAFLKVSPLTGETKTSSSNSGMLRPLGSSTGSSKTVTRNMKWNCEVSYRGAVRPEQVEVRVFYIGYEGKGMTPKVLGSKVHQLKLSETGRASVELVSPTVRLSRSTSSASGSHSNGGIRSTTTKVTGERMGGCVVQLFEKGELVKSWASNSTWAKAAKDPSFSAESLTRKDPHGLN